jgi:hypothetical protein
MSSTQSFNDDNQNPISTIDQQLNAEIIHQADQNHLDQIPKSTTWTERIKNYFITNDGRIILSNLFFTLICVILQHVMGTCHHSVSDGTTVIKWHVFTPPCMCDLNVG